jgi:hypothetical protein
MTSQVVRVDALQSLPAVSISSSYNQVAALYHPTRLLKIVNTCNADVFISFDGSTDNDYVPAGGFTLYDCTTNKTNNTTYFVFQRGTGIYVRSTGAPSSGAVYVVAIYGNGE